MNKFEEFSELVKTGLEEIQPFRSADQAKFWLDVYGCVAEVNNQMVHPYNEHVAMPHTMETIAMKSHLGNPLPIHSLYDPQPYYFNIPQGYVPQSDTYLYSFVHVVAHNERELACPQSLITTFVRLEDGIYMLMITGDERGMMLEVFPPHFWNRYLFRVKRNSLGSFKLPDASLFEDRSVLPTFEQMRMAVGHFVGRNWVFTTDQAPALSSKKRQKELLENEMVTVFVDGYSWDRVFRCDEVPGCDVIIHTSYIPWCELKDDQRGEVVRYKKQNLEMLLRRDYSNCLPDLLTWMTE